MPVSTTKVLKESLSYGYTGFNTSTRLLLLSPLVLGAGLVSGTISMPTAVAILSHLRAAPLVVAGISASLPIFYRAGEVVFRSNTKAALVAIDNNTEVDSNVIVLSDTESDEDRKAINSSKI